MASLFVSYFKRTTLKEKHNIFILLLLFINKIYLHSNRRIYVNIHIKCTCVYPSISFLISIIEITWKTKSSLDMLFMLHRMQMKQIDIFNGTIKETKLNNLIAKSR